MPDNDARVDSYSNAARRARTWRRRFFLLIAILLAPVAVVALVASRFLIDEPVTYADPEQHFKYGSLGGERESGFPFWVWQALPRVCAHHLPGEGYASVGMLFEGDRDLPVGVSTRRHLGMDRVFLNCAVCHTSTVRATPDSPPVLYSAMPANRFNLRALQEFFFNCAADSKFRSEYIVPEIDRLTGGIGPLERYIVYPIAISLMRERLLMLRGRFAYTEQQPQWGPGRVDTFNAAKALFGFPPHQLTPEESIGTADFPSIWNQRKRQGMQLHWDGNNTAVEERNKSAAFGTGTTPPTLDLQAEARIEEWLLDLTPPKYPLPIDVPLAAKGAPVYLEYCAGCHGASGSDFSGPHVGKVTPIEQIGTDRARLDSYTDVLAVNQSTLYAGYPHRFKNFRKTFGYANMPLDGLWLRSPYLHNGSVPTVRHLLEPAARRPKLFYRGNDVLDAKNLGFVWDIAEHQGKKYFAFDTSLPGNANLGHEGKAYGTELPESEKTALLEFLKTF